MVILLSVQLIRGLQLATLRICDCRRYHKNQQPFGCNVCHILSKLPPPRETRSYKDQKYGRLIQCMLLANKVKAPKGCVLLEVA